ncbi:MAG: hypothetical protein ACI9EF_003940 [Pseudohongiellaceae bacterium]
MGRRCPIVTEEARPGRPEDHVTRRVVQQQLVGEGAVEVDALGLHAAAGIRKAEPGRPVPELAVAVTQQRGVLAGRHEVEIQQAVAGLLDQAQRRRRHGRLLVGGGVL